ncbi:hypothetical protein [Falsiroseomonas tokyonensis]|uniref:RHS repeat protein n=1 Tax=Falsiroseomonas tokyonensis TaxID=430521 RepID=A0ABV7BS61_9PROT|nr:hypothetical protein [Falsiroseomonas tokyonensis]MBU8538483.1 hypothetical protein [Falsiroseomonas tokyonensis]
MSSTITVLDPISGEVDYEWVPYDTGVELLPQSATDYDLSDAHPWARYSIQNNIIVDGTIEQTRLTDVEILMDDGSSQLLHITYFDTYEFRGSETYTVKDAQGRTISVSQFNLVPPLGPPIEDVFAFRQQSIVYDAASGRTDFISTLGLDGTRESIDYDVATNQRDYVYIQQANGGTVSEDYNSANGVLDYRRTTGTDGRSLDQDYDSQGRLDYAVEHLADGRMRVTDYDLLNQHDWTSYSILYAASGAIQTVTVL